MQAGSGRDKLESMQEQCAGGPSPAAADFAALAWSCDLLLCLKIMKQSAYVALQPHSHGPSLGPTTVGPWGLNSLVA